jgi:hypothetical protein
MIDDCADYPEWQRKIEDEVGSSIHYMVIGFDESVRDELVTKSELFLRFVRY